MPNWSQNANIIENDESTYRDFLKKTGFSKIDHLDLVIFGDPIDKSFTDSMSFSRHTFAYGDTLSKISYKHYGDPRYWWVIAWMNSKPMDAFCKIGDILVIPKPLEEALVQYYSRNEI
tara:strand:+ start:1135 stop:1488 length:354 start_codon:yes stop_codon:yes gene_type:complete